jgi:hypothetical protein
VVLQEGLDDVRDELRADVPTLGEPDGSLLEFITIS